MWLSLVEHYVRDVGAAGSNPVIPTTSKAQRYFRCAFVNILIYRGVAQVVAHLTGGQGAAGSSPVTPTIRKVSVFIWILILFLHKIIHGRYSVIFRKMLSITNNGINKPNADYCLIFFKFFQIFYCIMKKTMIKYMLVSHNRVFHCLHNSRSERTNLIFRGGF